MSALMFNGWFSNECTVHWSQYSCLTAYYINSLISAPLFAFNSLLFYFFTFMHTTIYVHQYFLCKEEYHLNILLIISLRCLFKCLFTANTAIECPRSEICLSDTIWPLTKHLRSYKFSKILTKQCDWCLFTLTIKIHEFPLLSFINTFWYGTFFKHCQFRQKSTME